MANLEPIDKVEKEVPVRAIDQQVQKELPPTELLVQASPEDKQDIALTFGDATKEDGSELDPQSAKAKAVDSAPDSYEAALDEFWGKDEEPDVEKVKASVQSSQKITEEMLENPDFVYEQVAAHMGKDADAGDVRMATNMELGRRIVQKMKEREEAESNDGTPFFGSAALNDIVVDFGAMILRDTYTLGTDAFTDRTERQGVNILLKRAQLSPKEFKVWFQKYAEEVYNETLVSGNSWQIDQLEEELEGLGYDKLSALKKVFAVGDVIGVGQAVKSGAKAIGGISKALIKKPTKIGKVAILEGNEVAAEKAIVRAEAGDAQAKADSGPATLNPSATRDSTMNAPEGPSARALEGNKLAEALQKEMDAGATAKVLNAEEVIEIKTKWRANLNAKVANRIAYSDVVETGLGRFYHVARLGTGDGGLPFKASAKTSAPPKVATTLVNKLKLEGIDAEVVPVNINDLSKGWLVEFRQNIDVPKGLASTSTDVVIQADQYSRLSLGGILDKIGLGKYFSNSAWRDVKDIQALGFRGEQGRKVLNKAVEGHLKAIKATTVAEQRGINRVMTRYRDGKDAARRVRYSDQEFKAAYKELELREASQKVLDAYHAISDIEDTAWVLKSNEVLMRYVSNGYRAVDIGLDFKLPAKRTNNLDEIGDKNILSVGDGNATIRRSDLKVKDVVFKLDKPHKVAEGEYVEYVTKTKGVSELEPSDVFGYNPGGTRHNENARFFISMEGINDGARNKTILSATTPKQAAKATDEINTLIKAGDDITDDLVLKNNSFRPEVDSVAEFKDWAKKVGLDSRATKVVHKERDLGLVLDPKDGRNPENLFGDTYGDQLANDLRREDKVLNHYGGGDVLNADPMSAVIGQFENTLQNHAMKAYTMRSQVSWVKEALRAKKDWFPKDINDHYRMFMNAEVKGTTPFDNRMRELQAIYKRRMGVKGPLSEKIDEVGLAMGDYILDKTGIALGAPNITNKMMSIAFQSVFGFANPAQLFLQASHAATIIAASPRAGFKGAGLALTTRAILATADKDIFVSMRKNIAAAYDISEKQVDELIEIQRTSGRSDIDGDILENGTGAGIGWKGLGGSSKVPDAAREVMSKAGDLTSKAMDAGLVFFNTGERLAARTALYTASLEYMAKHEGKSILTEHARNWIAKRDQDLSFAMTNHARSSWQSGMMKLPTQWLSHSIRSMETVLVGRGFTGAERARMAVAMGPMLGLNGLGFAWAAENINTYLGNPIAEDSAMFTGLKWGVYDGVMDALLPEEDGEGRVGIGFSTRMAPISAFTDLYSSVFGEDKNFANVIAGPSGEIGWTMAQAVGNMLSSVKNGQDITLNEDIIKVLRQPSGIDNIAKAAGILANGIYESKNGTVLPSKMTATEGVLQLLGIGSLKQQEWYDMRSAAYKTERDIRSFQTGMKGKVGKAHRLIFDSDATEESIKQGTQIVKELMINIKYGNFPPAVQRSLHNGIYNGLTDDKDKMNKFLIKMGRFDQKNRIDSVMGNNN